MFKHDAKKARSHYGLLQECSSCKYASIDGVGFDLTSQFQDGGHNVISRR